MLIGSAIAATALTIGFYYVTATWAIWLLYCLVYQATNGTWSGAGYAYWAESFPTRVRGTAIGWLGAMFSCGLIIGSGIWTALIGSSGAVTFLIVPLRPGAVLGLLKRIRQKFTLQPALTY